MCIGINHIAAKKFLGCNHLEANHEARGSTRVLQVKEQKPTKLEIIEDSAVHESLPSESSPLHKWDQRPRGPGLMPAILTGNGFVEKL